ncbi:methyltransferase [Bacillus dakarensis]|uniref:methyltransferase n=1 Tax=Robertmurraya dakarensis TaxID=1926278 RepID=UPI000981D9B3|nr:methyltransferase [Bacillus dakarensis]
MTEQSYEKLLNIKTTGEQKNTVQSFHYYPYEPTPYGAIEELFKKVELGSGDRFVDFGCGKGRLLFYLNYFYDVTVVGVEMNTLYYQEAMHNTARYFKKTKKDASNIHFYNCLAEEYEINEEDNIFYFFNPFSIQIFMKILNNILLSVEGNQRNIKIILYYGSEDYVHYLESHPSFKWKEEIIIPGFYQNNPFERFLVYELS